MFILASTSPRRRELIKLFGLDFKFVSVEIDESPRDGESAPELVERLSRAKAAQASKENRDALVIAADTVVVLGDQILGKPIDARDAERMLKRLRDGGAHTPISGLTAMQGTRQWTQIVQTTVRMRDYTDAEIAAYVATGDPLDKAAAYAIQNSFRPVAKIEGCQANVMGLPLCHLYLALKRFGVVVSEPDAECQEYLSIVCPVARDILKASEQLTVISKQ